MADRQPDAVDPAASDLTPDDPVIASRAARHTDDGHRGRFWRELPVLIVIALVIAIVVKTFLVQAFYIPSESMEPTLVRGDRVLVCRFCYRFGDIQRGDVIVFADPDPVPHERGPLSAALRWLAEGIGVAQPEDEDFIKRVAGLPGDVLEIRRGQLYVNGEEIEEPYLASEEDTRSYGPVTVPDGMLFVLGDNRLVSGDSRLEPEEGGVGLVPVDRVIGRAFVIVWPPAHWGGL